MRWSIVVAPEPDFPRVLPRLLLVTPAPTETATWLQQLRVVLASGVRLVQLRAPQLSPQAYAELARAVQAACSAHGAELLVNAPHGDDVALARAIGAAGVHRPARRPLAARPDGLLVSTACHDAAQLRAARHLGADLALLSPVLPTASHPGAPTLGWDGLRALVPAAGDVAVFALGGLGPAHLDAARDAGAWGVAAIRGLWGTSDPGTRSKY